MPLPVDPTGAIATLNQPTLENSNPGKTNLATNECLYFRLVFEILNGWINLTNEIFGAYLKNS